MKYEFVLVFLLLLLPAVLAANFLEKYQEVENSIPMIKGNANSNIRQAQNAGDYNQTLFAYALNFANNADIECVQAPKNKDNDISGAYDKITFCYFDYYRAKYTATLARASFYFSEIEQKIKNFKPYWYIPSEIPQFNATKNTYQTLLWHFERDIQKGYPDNVTYILQAVRDFDRYDDDLSSLLGKYVSWNSDLNQIVKANTARDSIRTSMNKVVDIFLILSSLIIGIILGQWFEKYEKRVERKGART